MTNTTIDVANLGVHEFEVLHDFECRHCGLTPAEVDDETYCEART